MAASGHNGVGLEFANHGEAERCVSMARECMALDPSRSRRLLQKALRLWPQVPHAAVLLQSLNERTSRSGGDGDSTLSTLRQSLDSMMQNLNQYIHPQYRSSINAMALCILFLLAMRAYQGRDARFELFALPGDIYYRSARTFISFPITSTVVLSLIIQGLVAFVQLITDHFGVS